MLNYQIVTMGVFLLILPFWQESVNGNNYQGYMNSPQSSVSTSGVRMQNPTNSPPPVSNGLPANNRLQKVQIIDNQGFGQPMVASTLLVPQGWQTSGGVLWNPQNLCSSGYNFDFKASSPDGMQSIHIFPMERWQWNSMGTPSQTGCPAAKISSVKQYLENLVQRARPGARILDYRDRLDISQKFKQFERIDPMPMGEMRTWVEAGEVLIGYRENGVEIRETAASAVVFTLSRMQGMAGMAGYEFISGSTFPGFSMRAPDGQYNFELAERIRSSGVANPQWTARINKHNAKLASINRKGVQKRSNIIAKTGDEIRQMQADSWKKQSDSFDYLSRESSEAIRGVETYNDPYSGGTVELDNSYNHAWQLNNGQNILTNDPNFDPNTVFPQEGQRLEVTP